AAASGERFALQLRLPARGEPAILIPERQNPTLTKTWGSSAICGGLKTSGFLLAQAFISPLQRC
ncbi:hypothetical protein, partial [Burkholderia pseudomallei]|uniref:hypothetical protein n=1 Tax=Burkholderia pseudomallei TaxID=28450 RepID=UPI001E36CDFD